jgi:hypothetical protein
MHEETRGFINKGTPVTLLLLEIRRRIFYVYDGNDSKNQSLLKWSTVLTS